MDKKSKIILIAGPTASGKSNFAIKLAKKVEKSLKMKNVLKWGEYSHSEAEVQGDTTSSVQIIEMEREQVEGCGKGDCVVCDGVVEEGFI